MNELPEEEKKELVAPTGVTPEKEPPGDADTKRKTQEKSVDDKKKDAKGECEFTARIPKIDLSKWDGAIFTGVEHVCKEAGRIDSKVTGFTGGLLAKLVNYINDSKEKYKRKDS